MFIITMSSDEYGSEEFSYDTREEALEGLFRLADRSLEDGVHRTFTIVRVTAEIE